MICWYCYWGWPEAVAQIFQGACDRIGRMAMWYGPGHIVWSDENFEDSSIDFCIAESDKPDAKYGHCPPDAIAVVRESLVKLREIPIGIRCCEPADYDGEHPENYPPPAGVVMVRKHEILVGGAG